MTLKVYLSGIVFATILALSSFFLLLGYFSPENADGFLISLVFFSLFVGLAGLLGLVGFFLRKKRYKTQAPFRFLGISFRQGTLLALLLAASLTLRTFKIFWPWSSLILLLAILAIEIFFLRKQE